MTVRPTIDPGQHDALPEHAVYGDPWPLLSARCRLLDALDLAEHAASVVATRRGELSAPLREALRFHSIHLSLTADALSATLANEPGADR
ncbi:hypothetical protein [Geodermatophilus sabuli]|uniref:Uncharacterized protein n=1 Tax=Geodermatophilus sabuli TaxID=1564158 RepID=A0A285EFV7_9ACTN|nr:hypothetical protein [Geodermatophilus sabuli]MBB3082947.1 hypothetical protein [Geodermatophilus sabuli]SNX97945.1 hypothetical protein SAMN06893097_10925 [Geodermatophilus sabuli]